MSEKMLAVVGSVLAALLVIVGVRTFIDLSGGHEEVGKAGYELPDPKAEKEAATAPTDAAPAASSDAAAPADAASADAGSDVVSMIAAADAADGKKIFRRCGACHTSKQGDKPGLGPNLWGVVGRNVASQEAFTGYSDAMKGKGGSWTVHNLAEFLKSPKTSVPGTRMIFGGVKKDKDLANLLAYLKTLADGG